MRKEILKILGVSAENKENQSKANQAKPAASAKPAESSTLWGVLGVVQGFTEAFADQAVQAAGTVQKLAQQTAQATGLISEDPGAKAVEQASKYLRRSKSADLTIGEQLQVVKFFLENHADIEQNSAYGQFFHILGTFRKANNNTASVRHDDLASALGQLSYGEYLTEKNFLAVMTSADPSKTAREIQLHENKNLPQEEGGSEIPVESDVALFPEGDRSFENDSVKPVQSSRVGISEAGLLSSIDELSSVGPVDAEVQAEFQNTEPESAEVETTEPTQPEDLPIVNQAMTLESDAEAILEKIKSGDAETSLEDLDAKVQQWKARLDEWEAGFNALKEEQSPILIEENLQIFAQMNEALNEKLDVLQKALEQRRLAQNLPIVNQAVTLESRADDILEKIKSVGSEASLEDLEFEVQQWETELVAWEADLNILIDEQSDIVANENLQKFTEMDEVLKGQLNVLHEGLNQKRHDLNQPVPLSPINVAKKEGAFEEETVSASKKQSKRPAFVLEAENLINESHDILQMIDEENSDLSIEELSADIGEWEVRVQNWRENYLDEARDKGVQKTEKIMVILENRLGLLKEKLAMKKDVDSLSDYDSELDTFSASASGLKNKSQDFVEDTSIAEMDAIFEAEQKEIEAKKKERLAADIKVLVSLIEGLGSNDKEKEALEIVIQKPERNDVGALKDKWQKKAEQKLMQMEGALNKTRGVGYMLKNEINYWKGKIKNEAPNEKLTKDLAEFEKLVGLVSWMTKIMNSDPALKQQGNALRNEFLIMVQNNGEEKSLEQRCKEVLSLADKVSEFQQTMNVSKNKTVPSMVAAVHRGQSLKKPVGEAGENKEAAPKSRLPKVFQDVLNRFKRSEADISSGVGKNSKGK